MTTFHWIKGVDKVFKQFVENRVKEIREIVPPESWSHCPGKENPADLPSRGVRADALKKSEIWWHGPPWLVKEKQSWPKSTEAAAPPVEYFGEMRISERPKNNPTYSTGLVVKDGGRLKCVSKVFDVRRYSTFGRLVRVTALVQRFLHNLRSKRNNKMKVGLLSVEEYKDAEKLWLTEMQETAVKSPRYEDLKYQLGLYADDDGLLKCKGRLQNATIPVEARHPILLPSDHYLTELIIKDCHQRVLHNGVKGMLTELRSQFWVVKARQAVRKIVGRCVKCKRIEGKHYRLPKTAPLPHFRVEENPAFTNTGIDFAGPLYVRSSVKESPNMDKVYIALCTCGSSRAVHLDVVPDRNAKTFIRCFKRFTGRRGIPKLVVTDNAKTFKSAARYLSTVFELPAVQEFLLGLKVTWRFNLERAPWWGGFFEHLVHSVKRCLKKILLDARLTYEELLTVIIDIECVLNSRPLTYVSSDDTEEPLTPAHLMLGQRLLSIPDDVVAAEEEESEVTLLTKRQRYITSVLSHFWNRWKREYIVELREHHRERKGNSNNLSEIQVGDIVTVMGEGKCNHGTWKLGRIQSVHQGNNGLVRGATVDITSNSGKRTRLKRPLAKLFPLEVHDTGTVAEKVKSTESRQPRTRRRAAEEGEARRRQVDQRYDELSILAEH